MAIASDSARWEALAAARTRGDVGDGIASVLAFLGRPDVISFAGGFPDPETFPRERIAALLQELAAAGEVSAFQYAPTRGLAGALEAFADRLARLQGRRPGDDELLITSGGIEALELVGKSFLDPGDVVVVEAPTYLGSIQSFRSFEAALVPVTLDEQGLAVDELEQRLADGLRPKLVYTIPDHQNPAGVSLAADRRTALVELCSPLRLLRRRGRRVPGAQLCRRADDLIQKDRNDYSLWIRQTTTASNVQIVPPQPGVVLLGATVTPDGSFVDFVRRTGEGLGIPELWRVPFLGGAPKRTIGHVDSLPDWSPDGKRVAFTRIDYAAGSSALLVADADGSHERAVATRRSPMVFIGLTIIGRPSAGAVWSPDGRTIAALDYAPDAASSIISCSLT